MQNGFTRIDHTHLWLRAVTSIGLAALLAACSSSSDAPSQTVSDAGASDSSSDPHMNAGGDDAGPADYDAAIASCASAGGATALAECCQVALPGGWQSLLLAEQHCVCGVGGTCSSVCGYSECASVQGSSEACQGCLEDHLAGSCAPTIQSACAADRACAAYEACLKQ